MFTILQVYSDQQCDVGLVPTFYALRKLSSEGLFLRNHSRDSTARNEHGACRKIRLLSLLSNKWKDRGKILRGANACHVDQESLLCKYSSMLVVSLTLKSNIPCDLLPSFVKVFAFFKKFLSYETNLNNVPIFPMYWMLHSLVVKDLCTPLVWG